MAQNGTYRRGQVEWALWRAFTLGQSRTSDVPQIFRTRIKRLLELDRAADFSEKEVPPTAEYAFAPPCPPGSIDVDYASVDAFCLALGLDLLDAGFKQGEIVLLMRYIRPKLDQVHPGLLTPPSLIDRQRHPAKYYPKLPSSGRNGRRFADRRVFVVLQKRELTEALPEPGRGRRAEPVILEPVFYAGAEALGEALGDLMPGHRRTVTVLEIAFAAQAVQHCLERAPLVRRGRPKG